MNHRDRVIMALNHQEPDRCPMQISFTPEFAERISRDLQQAGKKTHNPHGGGNTYELERALDQDMLLTSVGWANSYYADARYDRDADGTYTDEWGVTWKRTPYETKFGRGSYTEMVGHPLADDQAVEAYRPPDPHQPELYVDAERVVADLRGEYWIVGATVTTIFETAWALRGYERLLLDLVLKPELVERILDIPFRYHLAAARRLVQIGVDMLWLGDDVGAQGAMLMSPATWRTFLRPRMAGFIAEVKQINPALKVAYHSDGAVEPIIPDLIEIGVDVLNPIQPACMDCKKLKRDFGRHLCFWGSIDEQHTLPFGTPADVEAEVVTRLNTLGKGGGLIIGPTHHVQLDTPLENFWAMVRAITRTPYGAECL